MSIVVVHDGAFAGCAQCHWPELRAQFFFYFAMSSPSGAAQASKAIGLIVEYLKKPENQAEARELCYSQRCSITLRNSYGCELTFSVARTV